MTTDIILVSFDNIENMRRLLGPNDEYIDEIELRKKVSISVRGTNIYISGDEKDTSAVKEILEEIYKLIERGKSFTKFDLETMLSDRKLSQVESGEKKQKKFGNLVLKTRKRDIVAITETQAEYLKTLFAKEIVFAIGPAGTGKTYLAVAFAVLMFLERKVERIILSRPAIEAGEKLGFLPGDLKEKIDPYLRPLYDALYDMVHPEIVNRYLENNEIEIAPLAFMRGRTLNNAFIILDEAQNTTAAQMKMFLTRLGSGSRMVITGDPSQTDLAKDQISGLSDAARKLKEIKEIGFINFKENDIVRHSLTTKIVEAYNKFDKKNA